MQSSCDHDAETQRLAPNNCDGKQIRVVIDPKNCHQGEVINESLGGIGLQFETQLSLKLGQKLEITYNGVKMWAIVRHVGTDEAGKCRVGFEWKSVSFSERTKHVAAVPTESAQIAAADAWEIAQFRDSLPRGLYVMIRFFDNEKWRELGETGDRLSHLADRCGLSSFRDPVQQLKDAARQPNAKEPARAALRRRRE